MPVTEAANDFQMRRTSDHESAQADAETLTPMQHDPFDLDQIMMNHRNSHSAPSSSRSPPQLDVAGTAQFRDFSLSYNGVENKSTDQNGEDESDPYKLAHHPDHRGSVTSIHSIHRESFSSGMPGQIGNASISGGSEDASPSSLRAGTGDGGFGDEFGLGSSGAVDGSDLGSRTREEKNDPAPAWSELKTKAGKERKRLPLACIACRRKKIRCSGEKPACKHCLRSRIPCVYKVTTRKAAPRTDYMAMLDKRLKRMEERIIKIVPKEEQDPAAVNITRAAVKPSIPGTTPSSKESKAKKRAAEEAFGPDLENWSKSASTSKLDTLEKPSSLQIQEAEESKLLLEGADKLPAKDIQEHLSEIFFENVYGQTYHVLHKPSFMRKLRGGTLPPVLILAVCAVSARFSSHPKVNSTPAFLRGEEWASEARDIVMRRYEWPNITILTCLLILGLHEFGTCQGGRSWALGGQAIRMAYALQLHRDLDYDPLKRNGTAELSFIDREIRRRTMWACFLMDRFNSSGTDRPTFIKEQSIKIQLPIKEKYFHLDMPGPTENLKGEVLHPASPGTGQLSNARDNMGVAAYMIKAIALWGQIINYLNLGGNEEDPHPMWHPESKYAELIKQSEAFDTALPEDHKYNEENLHTHETEGLANQYLFLHMSIQQNILFLNRFAVPRHPGGRPPKDVPKEFVTKAGAKAFEAANRISDLLKDGEPYFVTAPFTGYCAFLSSTVHIFGVFSKNTTMEAASKKNLATNVKYLSRMKRYWGMFHWMSENLKEQYRLCADAARRGPSALGSSQPSSNIFQYGDWFDRYPHGVSQSDFEDPAIGIKKEKGDDAVLGQKTDYHTVEDFFHSLGEMQTSDFKPSKANKRKPKKIAPTTQDLIDPIAANMSDMTPQLQMQNSGQQVQQAYNPLSPTSPVNMYSHNQQAPYYNNHDLLLPPHQQGILPQLDRQLVFGAYAGMDPSSLSSQNMLDSTAAWDIQMGGMHGFVTEPSSAWFMPFNIDPPVPEAAQEADVFNAMGGTNANYGMGSMPHQ